jgi:tetratricopeptide (TPR) repeat protein
MEYESQARRQREKDQRRRISDQKKQEYKDARTIVHKARRQTDQKGREYLKAEEQYKRLTGHYRNPQNQEFWSERLGASYRLPDEERPTDPESENYDPEQAIGKIIQSAGGIQNALNSGATKGQAAGVADRASQDIKGLTQGILINAQRTALQTIPSPGQQAARDFSRQRPAGAKGSFAAPAAENAFVTPNGASTQFGSGQMILLSPDRERPSPYAKKKAGADAAAMTLRSGENKFLAGDFQGALRDAEKHIAENPNDPLGYNLKAKALNRMRKFEEAQNAALRALELKPDDPDALRQLTWAQLHQKNYAGALISADRLILIEPNNAQAYLLRAFALEKLGRKEEMLDALKRAAQLNSKYRGHYQKALTGSGLFDPNDLASHSLFDALKADAPREINPKIILGGVLLLFAFCAAALPAFFQFIAGFFRKSGATSRRPRPAPAATPKLSPPVRLPELTGGALLAQKYRLGRVIGHGGMGKVWEAVDETLERRVAIKQTVTDAGEQGSIIRKMYIQEAQTLAGLRHPNIVDIFEILDRADGIYLVLEFVEGKTAQQILIERKTIPLARAQSILIPVAAALEFAHGRGIIHRDLKPSNIMMDTKGYIKVMDFGIARSLDEKPPERAFGAATRGLRVQHTQTMAGTPAYMPPESRKGKVSPATDTFGLGAVFYELLTGETPFGDEGWTEETAAQFTPASARIPGIDARADELIARCLNPDMDRRIPTALEFASLLRSIG